MIEENKTIAYKVKSIQEMQNVLKTVNGIKPIAGATGFLAEYTDEKMKLPARVLVLNSIPELKNISKTDKYIDFGACVTLGSIISLGKKNIPSILYEALEQASNISIRSLSTIGGNIAMANPLTSAYLPLLALEARLEIRTGTYSEWIPLSRYSAEEFRTKPHVITKVRIQDEPWTWGFYRRIGRKGYINRDSANFLFLIRVQKNTLNDMRFMFAGTQLVRSKEFDNLLLGRILPLPEKEIPLILNKSETIFTEEQFGSPFHRKCFFNLMEDCLYRLS